MSDTTIQECNCCETDGDCINGLCQSCSGYKYKESKALEEENKRLEAEVERLLAWIDYYGLMEKVKQGGKP